MHSVIVTIDFPNKDSSMDDMFQIKTISNYRDFVDEELKKKLKVNKDLEAFMETLFNYDPGFLSPIVSELDRKFSLCKEDKKSSFIDFCKKKDESLNINNLSDYMDYVFKCEFPYSKVNFDMKVNLKIERLLREYLELYKDDIVDVLCIRVIPI